MRQARWLPLTMTLMVTLIAFSQMLWIRKDYRDEVKIIQIECSVLLRETFFEQWYHPDPSMGVDADTAGLDYHQPYTLNRLQPSALGPLYTSRLRQRHPTFDAEIMVVQAKDTLPHVVGKIRTLPIYWNYYERQTLVAEVSGYEMTAWRRILPTILISVMFVVGIAVTMTLIYRSVARNQALAQRQRQFISNVTHELKTPVATVKVALEALKNFNALKDTQRTQEYLDMSILELNRLNLISDRLLELSQLESGKTRLQFEACDLRQTCMVCMEGMRTLAAQKSATISMEQKGNSFVVEGDPVHLQNAILNLLDNAIKYSQQGCKVTLSLVEQPDVVKVTVADDGPGIAKEEQKRIFEKFYRIQRGDQHNVKGYGLGLSYVMEVMGLHGGEVKLDSSPGAGSKFTLTILKKRYGKH